MGKFLESVVLQRLQTHLEDKNGLSGRQFHFQKGKFTIDAIKLIAETAQAARKRRRRRGKREGFCAIIMFDISNAFNSVSWK